MLNFDISKISWTLSLLQKSDNFLLIKLFSENIIENIKGLTSDQFPTRHGQACPYQVWTGSGRALCYKTFLTENSGFLPGFPIFPDFYWTKLPVVISGFRKAKLSKNRLIIVGDSKQWFMYVHTQPTQFNINMTRFQ